MNNNQRTIYDWSNDIRDNICPMCQKPTDTLNKVIGLEYLFIDIYCDYCKVFFNAFFCITTNNIKRIILKRNNRGIVCQNGCIEIVDTEGYFFNVLCKIQQSLKNIFYLKTFEDIENEIIRISEMYELLK